MTRTTTTRTLDGRSVESVRPRLDGRSVLTAVRSFYLDLAEWADDDPARWGPWVARCPVSASEASHKKDRTRRKSRTDQRTRERLPVLPALVAWADTEHKAAAGRLEAARSATPGEMFTIGGVTLRRTVMKTETTTGRIWAEDPLSGDRRDLIFEEHRAFWTWAMVEVLRLTGVRIEELTELPDPVPAAGHRRADPAAADRPVQDRHRTSPGHQPRTRRRVVHDQAPDPRRRRARPAGGVLRRMRAGL